METHTFSNFKNPQPQVLGECHKGAQRAQERGMRDTPYATPYATPPPPDSRQAQAMMQLQSQMPIPVFDYRQRAHGMSNLYYPFPVPSQSNLDQNHQDPRLLSSLSMYGKQLFCLPWLGGIVANGVPFAVSPSRIPLTKPAQASDIPAPPSQVDIDFGPLGSQNLPTPRGMPRTVEPPSNPTSTPMPRNLPEQSNRGGFRLQSLPSSQFGTSARRPGSDIVGGRPGRRAARQDETVSEICTWRPRPTYEGTLSSVQEHRAWDHVGGRDFLSSTASREVRQRNAERRPTTATTNDTEQDGGYYSERDRWTQKYQPEQRRRPDHSPKRSETSGRDSRARNSVTNCSSRLSSRSRTRSRFTIKRATSASSREAKSSHSPSRSSFSSERFNSERFNSGSGSFASASSYSSRGKSSRASSQSQQDTPSSESRSLSSFCLRGREKSRRRRDLERTGLRPRRREEAKIYVTVRKEWGWNKVPEKMRSKYQKSDLHLMEAMVGSQLQVLRGDGADPGVWWLVKDPTLNKEGWFPVACCMESLDEYERFRKSKPQSLGI